MYDSIDKKYNNDFLFFFFVSNSNFEKTWIASLL